MTILTQGKEANAFRVSESAHTRSLERVTVLAGSGADRVLTAGMVLGKRFVGSAAAVAGAGNAGDGAMGAITVTGPAKPGVYTLLMIAAATDAGTFAVFDPDGVFVGVGTVTVAFSAGGLAFTLADGGTDFAVGDTFAITVTPTDEDQPHKWLQFSQDGTLGEQVAAGILRDDVTAPDGTDAEAVVFVRDCEVNRSEIVWPSDIETEEQELGERQLRQIGIFPRTAI